MLTVFLYTKKDLFRMQKCATGHMGKMAVIPKMLQVRYKA